MVSGRPTKYNDETLETAKDYLDNYEARGDLVPSLAGLARILHITRETINQWKQHEDKQRFSDICEAILAEQEHRLLQGGLGGDYNPTIAKLMLTKHGYTDRTDHDIKSDVTYRVIPADEEAIDASD